MENKVIFLNIDTQKDFMLKRGSLYIAGAEDILDNLSRLTSLAVKKGYIIVNTGDYHTKDDEEISEKPDFVNTFCLHCIAGEEGSEYVNETYPKLIHRHYHILLPNTIGGMNKSWFERSKDIIIYKNKFDMFEGNKYTEEVFKILNPQHIITYGVATDYCVKYGVEGLLKRGYEVSVVTDAIKGINKENSDKLLKEWNDRGVKLLTTAEVELYYGNT